MMQLNVFDRNMAARGLYFFPSEDSVKLERSNAKNMHTKGGLSADALRVSISSAQSTSSHGSAQDDIDSRGDVYIWGEVICDGQFKNSIDKVTCSSITRTDFLLPKPLESNLVLDVSHVACGVQHAALVTKQGEVFTWGEESAGRLGHGMKSDVVHPRLVQSLATCSANFVACGEFHTCAIANGGEFYSWGDGAYNVGLLGHGTNVSQWTPKRVSGPLEGLDVAYVSCGTWHTALISSSGKLFTFGDGTFGALGHGNKESVLCPREVESLSGLKTIAVACGVWHTAAVVEVIPRRSGTSLSAGKLFTWGDGDKYRLGHGNKESKLKPTCVASLIDYDIHKLACGHSLTICLTTSGQLLSMGSIIYGQLGNPHSDGKEPCLVEDSLSGEFVIDVACGSCHVAVLTDKNEVFTWGKGANGRLGHGDIEDRKIPTFVEALKDRPVKQIACGSSFTAAICQHKWVSGAEQSQCTSCGQPFGFTRKRHNCYNCGLVHCHACSSKKASKAALAPDPGKAYRVCDSCYAKLIKTTGPSGVNIRKNANLHVSGDSNVDLKSSKAIVPCNLDMTRNLDSKASKTGRKTDSLSQIRTPLSNSTLLQLNDVALGGGVDLNRSVQTPIMHSLNPSRAVSPFSRKSSPPRSATPVPTSYGLTFAKTPADDLSKINEFLKQENKRLDAQAISLRNRCEENELELKQSSKRLQEALDMAAEESAKSKAAKEVIRTLTTQLKDMAERFPSGAYILNGAEPHSAIFSTLNGHQQTRNDENVSPTENTNPAQPVRSNGSAGQHNSQAQLGELSEVSFPNQNRMVADLPQGEQVNRRSDGINDEISVRNCRGKNKNKLDKVPLHEIEDGSRSGVMMPPGNPVEAERIEQYEPGVYITLSTLHDGTRDLKRVRFSRRRFGEHQAEAWWSENREKVYERYNVRGLDRVSSAASTHSAR